MRDIMNWALLCTTNDPESLTIVRIARALGIPLIASAQTHGATLTQEPHLLDRIAELRSVTHLAIVEIPGPREEADLEASGIEVRIIDHHTYPDLDRMQNIASLTQFLELFHITNADLAQKGFDPDIIHGVAFIDQGFLWELASSNLSREKQREVRAYYLACKREIQPKYAEIEKAAHHAWETHEIKEGVLIIRSESPHHIREAVSFCIADAYPEHPPASVVLEGDGRISVQETEQAEKLFANFGGFLFGKKRCWGMLAQDRPPSVDEILANIRQ
jgi:hypothetical protein